MFWYFAPVQSSVIVQATPNDVVADSYPSTDLSTVGHILYALLWICAVGAYSVFVTYQHFTAPDKETFLHEPALEFPPVNLSVNAWCTNRPNCGNLVINADYSSGLGPCGVITSPVRHTYTANQAMPGPVHTPLCFTGEHVFSTLNDEPLPAGIGVTIDFDAINPGYFTSSGATAVVELRGANGMSRIINLESWQVKSVVVGQAITVKYGQLVKQEPYVIAVQYEGRRPSWRATTVVTLAPYADVTRVIQKRGDMTITGFMGLLGTCCGMAFFMNSLQPWFTDFFLFFFPGPTLIAKKKLEKEEKERQERERLAEKHGSVEAVGASSDDAKLLPA